MRIESQELQFNDHKQISRPLSPLQAEYLVQLRRLRRIDQLIEFYMSQGSLVHFQALDELVRELIDARVIQMIDGSATPAESRYRTNAPQSAANLAECPFFRNLPGPAVETLWRSRGSRTLKKGEVLFEEGEISRDLYLVTQGQLGLYRKSSQGGQIRINELSPGAVFGEGGFLLGQPRAGTVKAVLDSEVLVFSVPNLNIQTELETEKVRAVQPRLWALNALLKSETLRLLPAESLDQLVFSGEILQLKEGAKVFKEGEPGQDLYVVINGSVVISQGAKTINIMKAGDSFGEIALFFSGERRTASAHCQSDASLLVIRRNSFYQLLKSNLALAREMEKIALERLARDRSRQGGS